ncbi:MAG: CapA family protein [Gammaproteobacteria bacterium]|nr:CapA family protein [Gammaproteobacteria bacterium]
MRRTLLAVLAALAMPAHAAPVKLVFAGDVMLDSAPGRVVAAGRDPFAHFAHAFAAADYRIANLECPVAKSGTPDGAKIYSFRADPGVLRTLQGRFDALAVSNNHSGDFGSDAFLETLEHLDAHGLRHFGGGHNLIEAHAPLVIERGGMKIAILGYDEFKPRAFEAGPDWAGVAWSEDAQVIADIEAAKAAGADLVIPFMHWGWEGETEPTPRQRRFARVMIDAGAAAVVGGHPHVTQGAEIYRGKPIVYSLGNFVFDGFKGPPFTRGWLLEMTVDRAGVTGWRTLAADLDAEGLPHPVPGEKTPCGKAGDDAVGECVNP